jgi:hypothetical protein
MATLCFNPSFSIYMFEMNRLVSLYFRLSAVAAAMVVHSEGIFFAATLSVGIVSVW